VKAAVQRIIIFGLAGGTHLEGSHGGQGTIIRHIRNNGKTGTAVGAVRKRVSIAPVFGIKHLLPTFIARGHIRGDQYISHLYLAFANFKTERTLGRNGVALHVLNLGKGRGCLNEIVKERVQRRGGPFHFNDDTGGRVLDPPLQTELSRKTVHEGSEAHPLDNPFHTNMESRDRIHHSSSNVRKKSLFAAQQIFSTRLRFASLQIQNSPFGLKH